MRHVLMIGAAAICGLLAFGLNFLYLTMRTAPQQYVAAEQAIAAGKTYDKDSFKMIAIQGDVTTAAVPYAEVATLYGRVAPRNLEEGELVLWQDVSPIDTGMDLRSGENGLHIAVERLRVESGLLRVGDQVGFVVPRSGAAMAAGDPAASKEFEQLGPFRIVSINSRVVETPYGSPEPSAQVRIATLTVAVEMLPDGRSFREDANRLIQANAQDQVLGLTLRGRNVGGAPATKGKT